MPDITAKLAELIDTRQLAFNAGSDMGINIGTTAKMYRHITINDPETKEPLGAVAVPKLNLRVNFVQDKFCIAEVTDMATDDSSPALAGLFAQRKKVTRNRTQGRSDTVVVEIGEEATFHIVEPEE